MGSLDFLLSPPWIHRFFDPLTLGVFLLLGVVQVIVAIDSGILAILALPKEKNAQRRIHYGLFIFCAVVLFLSTIGIGILNDNSQRAADAKSQDIKEKIAAAGKESQWIHEYLSTHSVLTFGERLAVKDHVTILDRTLASKPSGPLQGAPVLTYTPPPVAAAPPPFQPQENGKNGLNDRILQLISTTWGLDHGYAYGAGEALRSYEKHGNGQKEKEWLDSAKARPQTRDAAYRDLQPEIAALRHDIQVALKWPDKKIEADDSYFDALNGKALKATKQPETLADDYDGSYKFVDIRQYFKDLDLQLGYTMPDGNPWFETGLYP